MDYTQELQYNHVIMDVQQNYYKVAYKVEKGFFKTLTYQGEDGYAGLMAGDDITLIYHMLNLIETEFKHYNPNSTIFSLAFDSRSERKDEDENYKSNREGKLTESGRDAIDTVRQILSLAGYNVFKAPGKEADDIIKKLVDETHAKCDMTHIYTNDADILMNLKRDVTIHRYKSSTGRYMSITPENFSSVMGDEYDCSMPYNCILLYKCLVGDKSDKVAGIKGYGKKAFDKLIDELWAQGFDFRFLINPINVRNILELKKETICKGDPNKLAEAYKSLDLVQAKDVELEHLPCYNRNLVAQHQATYRQLGFNSLTKAWSAYEVQ